MQTISWSVWFLLWILDSRHALTRDYTVYHSFAVHRLFSAAYFLFVCTTTFQFMHVRLFCTHIMFLLSDQINFSAALRSSGYSFWGSIFSDISFSSLILKVRNLNLVYSAIGLCMLNTRPGTAVCAALFRTSYRVQIHTYIHISSCTYICVLR